MTRQPTFLICGGQRCGSTYLWSLCRSHPEIFVPDPWFPEPKFFSQDQRLGAWFDYLRMFDGAGDHHRAIGEKSVTYMDGEETAERIRSLLRTVRLVFILRDPVRRAYSHYLYSRANCLESLSFGEAIIAEPYRARRTPAPLRLARPWSYVARGCYAGRLAPFYRHFPREQIGVFFFEDMVRDPGDFQEVFFNFLGVSSAYRASDAALPVNPSDAAERQTLETIEYLQHIFGPHDEALARLIGKQLPWRAADTQTPPLNSVVLSRL